MSKQLSNYLGGKKKKYFTEIAQNLKTKIAHKLKDNIILF